jgi:hypothetical protein
MFSEKSFASLGFLWSMNLLKFCRSIFISIDMLVACIFCDYYVNLAAFWHFLTKILKKKHKNKNLKKKTETNPTNPKFKEQLYFASSVHVIYHPAEVKT